MSSPIKQYTQLKKVYLILYSKKETNFDFLFFKFPHEGVFDIFSNEITLLDNGSIFAIARFMTINFPNFFTKNFFDTFPKSEIFPPQKIHNYKIWENETFIFWLDNLSQNLIQYDDLNEEIIYFYEIPYINIEELNTLTEKINYKIKFIYLNKENYNNEISISFQLKQILEKISFKEMESHIKNSIEKREK